MGRRRARHRHPELHHRRLPGTIHVEDEGEALIRPLRALNAEEIEIPRVAISGNFRSAVWFRSVSNVRFGHVDIRTPEDSVISATGGGVRIDGFAEGAATTRSARRTSRSTPPTSRTSRATPSRPTPSTGSRSARSSPTAADSAASS
ncbi:hypothetical protein ACFQL4_19825 [Halosimplex aquaticum]